MGFYLRRPKTFLKADQCQSQGFVKIVSPLVASDHSPKTVGVFTVAANAASAAADADISDQISFSGWSLPVTAVGISSVRSALPHFIRRWSFNSTLCSI